MLGESVLRDTHAAVADFRDRTVLAFDPKDVTGFEIVHARRDARGRERRRRLAAHEAGGAARRHRDVTRLPGQAERARRSASSWPRAPPSLRALRARAAGARDDPHRPRQGSRQPHAAARARSIAAKKGVYAMRPDEPTRAAGPRGASGTPSPRTSRVLRNKTLVEVDRDKVTRLRDREPQGRGGGRARRATSGRSSRPRRWPPTRSRSAPCSAALRELRAQAFLSDDAAGIREVPGQARGAA